MSQTKKRALYPAGCDPIGARVEEIRMDDLTAVSDAIAREAIGLMTRTTLFYIRVIEAGEKHTFSDHARRAREDDA